MDRFPDGEWGNPEVEEFSNVFPRVEVIIFWGALYRTEQEILHFMTSHTSVVYTQPQHD
jgi:hypothetical protein